MFTIRNKFLFLLFYVPGWAESVKWRWGQGNPCPCSRGCSFGVVVGNSWRWELGWSCSHLLLPHLSALLHTSLSPLGSISTCWILLQSNKTWYLVSPTRWAFNLKSSAIVRCWKMKSHPGSSSLSSPPHKRKRWRVRPSGVTQKCAMMFGSVSSPRRFNNKPLA